MRERQRHRTAQPSIIDKLIEEALLEFTSLTDEEAAKDGAAKPIRAPMTQASGAPVASGGGFVGSWIDEIAVGAQRRESALDRSLPKGLSAGNLAALEEGPLAGKALPPPPRESVATSATPSPPPVAASPSAPVLSAASSPPRGDAKGGAATKVGVAVALVVVMAAGAAAWFTHLIPHP